MKRSQLVKEITDILHGQEFTDFREETEDVADFIVGLVEKRGMLPPSCTVHQDVECGVDFDGTTLVSRMTTNVNQWDKE